MTRLIAYTRANAIAIAALFLALGGGYAIAATTASKTITACASKRTGELFLSTHGRCTKTQQKVAWNQQGPQGLQGMTGATGPAPPSAWAIVSNNGQALAADGITVQHVSTGTYRVTVTAAGCADKQNAPVVDVSSGNPPGSFPLAWVGDAGSSPFTVYTGVVTSGTFTPTDETFNIQDVCG